MRRKEIEAIKTEIDRLLQRIAMMERMAGWTNYKRGVNEAALGKKQPDDKFNSGQYTAAVKRASLDLSRALVEIRR